MKLATVRFRDETLVGIVKNEDFIAFRDLDTSLPDNMLALIEGFEVYKEQIEAKLPGATTTCTLAEVQFLPPLPNPCSFRDFMAFEEHIKNAGRHFGVEKKVAPAWYQMPVFYFSNHNSMKGSGEPVPLQPNAKWPDFEFEIGMVIGKHGINIAAADAADYIFGFTVLNDWSARDLQFAEMPAGLGPAKGKDYATSIGPVLVTKDEMDQYLCPDDPQRYDLATRLIRNGQVMRENNTRTIYHPFASLIERASAEVELFPGDLIGSGTIGGGTIIEYPADVPFLQHGDVIEMEVQGIGTLVNIVK